MLLYRAADGNVSGPVSEWTDTATYTNLESGSTYLVEGAVYYSTDNTTTTQFGFRVNAPGSFEGKIHSESIPTSATASSTAPSNNVRDINGSSVIVPIRSGENGVVRFRGWFKTFGDPNQTFWLSFKNNQNSSTWDLNVLRGSYVRLEKIEGV
ncbi:hypothetical protein [Nonomuraea sp. NPDC052265]|uniref:hypothetical protein n=1 Tax=Nonomuraea sp. NPDC052265 TaxID=3364374 RepID=UPI0037C4F421